MPFTARAATDLAGTSKPLVLLLIVPLADRSAAAAQAPGRMTWRAVQALAAFFLFARAAHSAGGVSCLDAAGNAVDWWIALKVRIS